MMRLVTFASGSGGNCALLTMDGVHLLLDAGISYRRICENLALTGVYTTNVPEASVPVPPTTIRMPSTA